MKRIPLITLSTLVFFLLSFTGKNGAKTISVDTFSYSLSGKRISVKRYIYPARNLNFLVLHDNENTGLEAAQMYCEQKGGSITEVLNQNERFISFMLNKSKYVFDPNGIFEEEGIWKTLSKYSASKITPAVTRKVSSFAKHILEIYLKDSVNYMLTLHNNTDGNFDINDYLPGGTLKSVADSVFINSKMDPDDFILVTTPQFYGYLKSHNINTVYQSPKTAIDGSLSVFAQRRNIPYVNLEVQHGHRDEHFRLINIVGEMFAELNAGNGTGIPLAVPDR